MKYIKILIMLVCMLPLIMLHIAVTHHALFYKIPTFQSLSFTEFGEYKYRGDSCYSVPIGKTGRAYMFNIERNGKIYKPLYTIPTQQECHKQLDELEQKHIKIWYGTKYTDYIFNRKESDVADFEIYQLEADDKIIISYQESLNKKERVRVAFLFVMVVLYVVDICQYRKITRKNHIEANYDYRRYGRL